MMDGNENIQTGKLAKALTKEPFNMTDSIRTKIGDLKFATHYRGQEQIDAIWISKNLEATKATVLPFFFRIGDHRGFMMDVPEELILGNKLTTIQRPYARRLICKKKEVQTKYIKELEYQIAYHKLDKKMDYIKNNKMNLSKEQTTNLLNQLDKEKTQAMTRAEAKCRKFNMGRVPYFPGLAMKAMNVIFWKAIKRRKEGAKVKIEYLKRLAKKQNFMEIYLKRY